MTIPFGPDLLEALAERIGRGAAEAVVVDAERPVKALGGLGARHAALNSSGPIRVSTHAGADSASIIPSGTSAHAGPRAASARLLMEASRIIDHPRCRGGGVDAPCAEATSWLGGNPPISATHVNARENPVACGFRGEEPTHRAEARATSVSSARTASLRKRGGHPAFSREASPLRKERSRPAPSCRRSAVR